MVSTKILLSKYHSLKESGLLIEMAGIRAEAGKVLDECRMSYCALKETYSKNDGDCQRNMKVSLEEFQIVKSRTTWASK